MHWSAEYVGLPWLEKGDTRVGVSCLGLCCLVYRERLSIVLPTYADRFVSSAERAEIAALYGEAKVSRVWHPVERESECEFDVVLFRIAGVDAHIGMVARPGEMLHISEGFDSRIERYGDGRWAPRLSGIYRHEART